MRNSSGWTSEPRPRAVESFKDSSDPLDSSHQSVWLSVESATQNDSLSFYMNIVCSSNDSVTILGTVSYVQEIYLKSIASVRHFTLWGLVYEQD
jgi:hypothetical protein